MTPPPSTVRPPKPRNATATRASILAVAQTMFQERGYDHVSMRDVARGASVDVALVHRYFGGKTGLFTEALKASIQDDAVIEWNKERFAAEFAARMADLDFGAPSGTSGFQLLLRAAASPATAPLLRSALQEKFLVPISDWLGDEDAPVRARLLTALTIGFLAEGLVRGERLVGGERSAFVQRTSSIIETILSAD